MELCPVIVIAWRSVKWRCGTSQTTIPITAAPQSYSTVFGQFQLRWEMSQHPDWFLRLKSDFSWRGCEQFHWVKALIGRQRGGGRDVEPRIMILGRTGVMTIARRLPFSVSLCVVILLISPLVYVSSTEAGIQGRGRWRISPAVTDNGGQTGGTGPSGGGCSTYQGMPTDPLASVVLLALLLCALLGMVRARRQWK